MKLEAKKLVQAAFGVNENVADELMKILKPEIVAELVAESLNKPVAVKPEKAEAKTIVIPPNSKNKAATKAAKQKSSLSEVREILKKNKGKTFRAADVAEMAGIDAKYAAKCLYYLYRKDEVKSHHIGVYFA